MKSHKPVAIARLISGTAGGCAALLQQSQRLLQLTRTLQEHLPEPLNRHCTVANINDGSLILLTDSPVWSSRLRFHAATILREVERRHGLQLAKVQIRVNPPEQVKPEAVKHKPRMSAPTAALLRQVAGSIADPALGTALRRLAQNYKKSSNT
jgi:hypothetical protein